MLGKGGVGTNEHLNYSCQNCCLHCCDLDKHKDGALHQSLDVHRRRGIIWSQKQGFFIIFHTQQHKKVAYLSPNTFSMCTHSVRQEVNHETLALCRLNTLLA